MANIPKLSLRQKYEVGALFNSTSWLFGYRSQSYELNSPWHRKHNENVRAIVTGTSLSNHQIRKCQALYICMSAMFTPEHTELLLSGEVKLSLKDIDAIAVDAYLLKRGQKKFEKIIRGYYIDTLMKVANEVYLNPEYYIEPYYANDFIEAIQFGTVKNYTQYRKQKIVPALEIAEHKQLNK